MKTAILLIVAMVLMVSHILYILIVLFISPSAFIIYAMEFVSQPPSLHQAVFMIIILVKELIVSFHHFVSIG